MVDSYTWPIWFVSNDPVCYGLSPIEKIWIYWRNPDFQIVAKCKILKYYNKILDTKGLKAKIVIPWNNFNCDMKSLEGITHHAVKMLVWLNHSRPYVNCPVHQGKKRLRNWPNYYSITRHTSVVFQSCNKKKKMKNNYIHFFLHCNKNESIIKKGYSKQLSDKVSQIT